MEAFAHSLLRPGRRTSRAIAALVVLALVGWLGVTAGHVHLPGEVAAHALGHADGHAHGHGDPDAHDGHGHPAGERTHPCSLCLTLDRGAAPSAPPAIVVAIVSATADLRAPDAPVASVASPAVYRSRAPPVA
jgi:hypothetical protein